MTSPRQDDAATPVSIVLNGRATMTAAPTMAALLVAEGFADQRVATARNGAFVPAAQRPETRLADGDHIEIVSARQGG